MDTLLLSQRLPGEDSCIEFPAAVPGDRNAPPRQIAALLAPTARGQAVPVSFSVTSFMVRAQCAPGVRHRIRNINIPLMFIESVATVTGYSGYFAHALEIRTKHVWTFVFGFVEEAHVRSTEKVIQQLKAVYMTHFTRLPAFDLLRSVHKGAGPVVVSSAIRGGGKAAGNAAAAPLPPSASSSRKDFEGSDDDEATTTAKAAQAKQTASEQQSLSAATAAAPAQQQPPAPFVDGGWTLYDEDAEMARQLSRNPTHPTPAIEDCGPGKDLRRWFHTTSLGSTRDYGYSPTYPVKIVVPNAISDGDLMLSAEFRSRQRVPAISFVHFRTGAVLARSSQPMLRQSERARFADATILRSFTAPYGLHNTKPLFEERQTATAAPAAGAAQPAPAGEVAPKAFAPPPSLFDEGGWGSPLTSPAPGASSPSAAATSAFANTATARPPPSHLSLQQNQAPLFVVDLRPSIAAKGNLARGGGWEVGQHFEFCEVSFAGIDNIFAVINSFAKLRAVIDAAHKSPDYRTFYADFDASGWLQHIHRILRAAVQVVDLLEGGKSVLSHCTDGWDRTAQCTSLAMLMIDPYFRTVRGFCVLVEKEFCSFGHQFAERLGHQAPSDTKPRASGVITVEGADGAISVASTGGGGGGGHAKPQDPSPIFLQWLDSVFQVMRQHPTEFEFTPVLLEVLAIEIYACLYGTFLGDHAKQRIFDNVRLGTKSLWAAIEEAVSAERNGACEASSAAADPQQPPTTTTTTTSTSTSTSTTAAVSGGCNDLASRHGRILNVLYDRAGASALLERDRSVTCGLKPIRPSFGLKRLVFWESMYLRFDPDRAELDASFDCYPGQHQSASAAGITTPAADSGDAAWKAAVERRIRECQVLPDVVANYLPSKAVAPANQHQDAAAAAAGDWGGPVPPQAAAASAPKRTENAKECWSCGAKFGFFKGMVPCAMCGMPFCSACAPFQAFVEQHGVTGKLCTSCHALAA